MQTVMRFEGVRERGTEWATTRFSLIVVIIICILIFGYMSAIMFKKKMPFVFHSAYVQVFIAIKQVQHNTLPDNIREAKHVMIICETRSDVRAYTSKSW